MWMGRLWFPIAVFLALSVMGAEALAATPAETYQAIEAVNAQLSAFHDANGTMPAADPQAPALTERLPRHVLQKAREVLLKIQAVRQLNGLPLQPVPEIPVREVAPDDVKFFLEKMLEGLKDLRSIFGNPPITKQSLIAREVTPTDNFAALRRAELQVDGLGLPSIAPNDVMRIALSIVNDLELIRAALGITTPVAKPPVIPARRPVDTYDNALGLLVDIKVLTENTPSLASPMGVVLPNRRMGIMKPAHVMDLLGTVLAEISAVKVRAGVMKPTLLAPAQTGMTPSDVHAAVSYARALVATIPGARPIQGLQGLEPHRHPEGQDTWVVLSGEGDYLVGGGKTRRLRAGDVAIANTGQVHGMRNTGTVPFIFISTVTSADAGVEPGENAPPN